MKFAVINDPDYVIYVEPCDMGHVLHADVTSWSKSVRKRFLDDLRAFQKLYKRDFYVAHFGDEDGAKKLWKFVAICGFKPWRLATAYDGRECTLMIKEYIDG